MLVSVDTPTFLDELYEEAKELGAQIFEGVKGAATSETIEAGTDVTARPNPSYLYVHGGTFKFVDADGNEVRFYTDRDFLSGGQTESMSGARIVCEETGEVSVFDREGFVEELSKNPHLLRLWMDLQGLESRIVHILGSVFLHDKVAESIRVATFEVGEVIVENGSEADEIFLLLEGRAEVKIGETVVGHVEAGEVFGEIAFLTHQRRTATVVAEQTCLVQVADNASFVRLARSRPQIVVDMARALARRVVALNAQLAGK